MPRRQYLHKYNAWLTLFTRCGGTLVRVPIGGDKFIYCPVCFASASRRREIDALMVAGRRMAVARHFAAFTWFEHISAHYDDGVRAAPRTYRV